MTPARRAGSDVVTLPCVPADRRTRERETRCATARLIRKHLLSYRRRRVRPSVAPSASSSRSQLILSTLSQSAQSSVQTHSRLHTLTMSVSWGIIGCGKISRDFVVALQKHTPGERNKRRSCSALGDPRRARQTHAAARHRAPRYHDRAQARRSSRSLPGTPSWLPGSPLSSVRPGQPRSWIAESPERRVGVWNVRPNTQQR